MTPTNLDEYLTGLFRPHDLTGLWVGVTSFRRRDGQRDAAITRYRKADDLDGIAADVTDLDAHPASTGVFLGQALADHPGPDDDRYKAADAAALTHLWVDLDIAGDGHADGKPYPPTVDDAMRVVDAIGLYPSVIKHSGNGLQLEYRFDDPWILDTDTERAEAAALVRDFIHTVRARAHSVGAWTIDSVFDLARVMRVPGTTNRKDPTRPKPVTLLEHHPARVYSRDELTAILADPAYLKSVNTGAINDEELRRVFAMINLSAAIRDARAGRAAEMIELASENLDESDTRLVELWEKAPRAKDDSEMDLSLGNSAFWLHRKISDDKAALQFAAVVIIGNRLRHGRKVEKVTERADYLARTLALVLKAVDTIQPGRAPAATLAELQEDVDAVANPEPARPPLALVPSPREHSQPPAPDVDEPPAATSAPPAKTGPPIDFTKSRRWDYSHEGNATRFAAVYGVETVAYVPGTNVTRTWRDGVWVTDSGTHLHSLVRRLTELMRAQAARETAAAYKVAEEAGDDPAAKEAAKSATKRAAEFDKWVTQSRMGPAVAHTVKAVRALPGVEVPAGRWNADDRLLNCANGTLRIDFDGLVTFGEHRAEDRITHKIGTTYDPNATSPRWEQFITWALPDPAVRRVFHQLAGLSLLGGNRRHLFAFLIGKSRSGKSTAMEVIGRVLGNTEDPALGLASSFKMTALRTRREASGDPQMVRLIDKRFAWGSEASDGWALTADVIKGFSGGDTLNARDNFARSGEVVDRTPKFSPWIVANHHPEITGADDALFERIRAVPFDQHRAEGKRDPELVDRIATGEAAGVLNWLLAGLIDAIQGPEILERGKLPQPCVALAERMRQSVDVYALFLAECCEPCQCESNKDCVPVADAWATYRSWAYDSNEKPGTKRAFGDAMTSAGYPTSGTLRTRPGGPVVRVRMGLSLNGEWRRRLAADQGDADRGGISIGA